MKKVLRNKYVIVAAGLILLLALLTHRSVRRIIRQHQELKKMSGLIASLEKDNAKLIEEIALAQSDKNYLERLARKELGLIQPGEIEYRFIDPEKKQ